MFFLFLSSLKINKKNDNHFKVNQEFMIPYDLPPLKYNNTGKSEKNEKERKKERERERENWVFFYIIILK